MRGIIRASVFPSHGTFARSGLRKMIGASAPAKAINEPTDRSMPAVAITSVIPVAIIAIGATSCKSLESDCTWRKCALNSIS